MKTGRWVAALLGWCLVGGWFLSAIASGIPGTFQENAGMAIGAGGLVFVPAGIGAAFVYLFTRNRTKALWAWTVLIALASVALTVGAVHNVRHPL